MGLPQREVGSVMWYRWASTEAFDAWHAAACEALGIPHPNHNSATGAVNETAQWTLGYTSAVIVADDDVRAVVEADAQHVAGLGEPSDPPPVEEVTEP